MICKLITLSTASLALSSNLAMADGEFDIGYDSKYVSEGRNNLDVGGIIWASGAASVNENVSDFAAYGVATDSSVDYDEFNLGLEYSFSSGDFDYYLGYTRLEFFEDDESDNEIGFSLVWNGNKAFTPFADFMHATGAGGNFVQLGLEQEIKLADKLGFTVLWLLILAMPQRKITPIVIVLWAPKSPIDLMTTCVSALSFNMILVAAILRKN
ncbi:MAG: hypothetical protein ACI88A_001017 [Paraglaciecola sp.]|jgi:hypothetical protein